nr:hypothetical protein CFP56_67794 [Quercus suber]
MTPWMRGSRVGYVGTGRHRPINQQTKKAPHRLTNSAVDVDFCSGFRKSPSRDIDLPLAILVGEILKWRDLWRSARRILLEQQLQSFLDGSR